MNGKAAERSRRLAETRMEKPRCRRKTLPGSRFFFVASVMAILAAVSGCGFRPESPQVEKRSWWTFSRAVIGGRVPVFITERNGTALENHPVRVSVPFPKGSLFDPDKVSVSLDSGETVNPDVRALTRWPDGSVRWAAVTFPVSLKANETRRVQLYFGSRATPYMNLMGAAKPEPGQDFEVKTGRFLLKVGKSGGGVREVFFDTGGNGEFSEDEKVLSAKDALSPAIRPSALLLDISKLASAGEIRKAIKVAAARKTPPGTKLVHCEVAPGGTETASYQAGIEYLGRDECIVRIAGKLVARDGREVLPYVMRLRVSGRAPVLYIDCVYFFNCDPHDLLPVSLGVDFSPVKVPLPEKIFFTRNVRKSYPDFAESPWALFQQDKMVSTGGLPLFIRLEPDKQAAGYETASPAAVSFPLRGAPRFCSVKTGKGSGISVGFWDAFEAEDSSLMDPLSGRDPAWPVKFEATESFRRFVVPEAAGKPDAPGALRLWRRNRSLRGAALERSVAIIFSSKGTDEESVQKEALAAARPPAAFLPTEWYAMAEVLPPVSFPAPEHYPRMAKALNRSLDWLNYHDNWSGNLDAGAFPTIYRRLPEKETWPRCSPDAAADTLPPIGPRTESAKAPDIGPRWYHLHGSLGWRADENGWIRSLELYALATGNPADYDRWMCAAEHVSGILVVHSKAGGGVRSGFARGPGSTHFTGKTAKGRYTYPFAWLDAYYLSGDSRYAEVVMDAADSAWRRLREENRTPTDGEFRLLAAGFELSGEQRFLEKTRTALKMYSVPRDPRFLTIAPAAHRLALLVGEGDERRLLIREAKAWLAEPPGEDLPRAEFLNLMRLWISAFQLTGRKRYALAVRDGMERLEILRLADVELGDDSTPGKHDGGKRTTETEREKLPPDFINDLRVLEQVDILLSAAAVLERSGFLEPPPPRHIEE